MSESCPALLAIADELGLVNDWTFDRLGLSRYQREVSNRQHRRPHGQQDQQRAEAVLHGRSVLRGAGPGKRKAT